jgi:hypothetical protein
VHQLVSEGGLELLIAAKHPDAWNRPELHFRVRLRVPTGLNLHPDTPEFAGGSITQVSRAGSEPEGDFVGDHRADGHSQGLRAM